MVHNSLYRCVSSKYRSNSSEQCNQYVLGHPGLPWDTPQPENLSSNAPEYEDGENGREDESKTATGHGSDEGNEVIKVRDKKGDYRCNEEEDPSRISIGTDKQHLLYLERILYT